MFGRVLLLRFLTLRWVEMGTGDHLLLLMCLLFFGTGVLRPSYLSDPSSSFSLLAGATTLSDTEGRGCETTTVYLKIPITENRRPVGGYNNSTTVTAVMRTYL